MKIDTKLTDVFLLPMMAMFVQFSLIRILSFTHWFHLVYLVVALALLGYAIGGFAFHFSSFFARMNYQKFAAFNYLGFSVCCALALTFGANTEINASKILIDVANGDMGGLIDPYLYMLMFTVLPFTFASLLTTRILHEKQDKGIVYSLDLAGNTVGVGLFILSFWYFTPLLSCLIVIFATLFFSFVRYFQNKKPAGALVFICFLLIGHFHDKPLFTYTIDQSKHLAQWLGTTFKIKTESSPLFRVDAVFVDSDIEKSDPAQVIEGTSQIILTIDGDATTWVYPVNKANLNQSDELFLEDIWSLRHVGVQVAEKKSNAVVIGSGGGLDVVAAYQAGFNNIYSVDIDPIRQEWLKKDPDFVSFTDALYLEPEIKTVVMDGRNFIRFSEELFDSIAIFNVDSLTGMSIGAYNLSESYLYTQNAINDYVKHLSPEGILQITLPPWGGQHILERMSLTFLEAVKQSNLGPESLAILELARDNEAQQHVFLIKKNGFNTKDIKKLLSVTERECCTEFLYKRGANSSSLTHPKIEKLVSAFEADSVDKYLESQSIDVRPVVDNKPFFYEREKFNGLSSFFPVMTIERHLLGTITSWSRVLYNYAFIIIFVTICLLTIMSVTLGRLLSNPTNEQPTSHLDNVLITLYFSGIGLGYMIFQMAYCQKISLITGHPILSLTITIPMMILGTGGGSLIFSALQKYNIHNTKSAVLLPVIAAVGMMVVTGFLVYFSGYSEPTHTAMRLIVVGALSFFTGITLGPILPLGLQILCRDRKEIALAWMVNSFTSVMGSLIAILIATYIGFTSTLTFAATLYLLPILVLAFVNSKNGSKYGNLHN